MSHLSSRRRLIRRFLAALLLAGLAPAAGPGQACAAERSKIVEVKVRNLSDRALKNVPVTFAQVFRKGDLPRSTGVYCNIGDAQAQSEVKRRYTDGSARLAILSIVLPELAAGGSKTLVTRAGPAAPPGTRPSAVALEDLLKTDFDAVVTLTFPDGAIRSVSARKMLTAAGGKATTWLHNHVASEWLVSGPPVGEDGEADADLNVQFHVRAYGGCKRVRVSVVVENCWDHWAGNIRYDARVTVGGKEVFAAKAVDHRRLSRWRKVFWWGGQRPPVHVAHDLKYICSTGALPNYDTTLRPPKRRSERGLRPGSGPRWRIMGRGPLTAYMPTTGGRPEIAPYPAWTVRALLTREPKEMELVLAAGDLSGSWPIHVRSKKTGRVLTIDERPTFWLDYRGPDKPTWKPDRTEPADPKRSRLTPDRAHQPSLAYVPYLLTGDFYYLEEAYFWGTYCLLTSWPHPRKNARGIIAGQVRGNAWSLRNIADAEFIACDGDPEARHFAEKVGNNLADMTRRMYGPPEYNKIGAWGIRTTTSARIQKPANPKWMILAAWENDYLIWSLHHLFELGHDGAARPRDFMLRLRVGALTNAPEFDPLMAAPYRFAVGEQGPDKKVTFYEDWKKLGAENAKLSKPRMGNYGNGYAYSARAAAVCGVDGGFPKAKEALKVIEGLLPGNRKVMAGGLYWAIVPRGPAAGGSAK